MSLPQVPEIFVGFRLRFCVLAILMETGWKSSRNSLQQKGLPHTPESADHLGLVTHADLPKFNAGAENGGQVLDQFTEINAPVRREEKQKLAAVKGALRRDKLHLQPMRSDLLLADFKGFLFPFLIFRVCAFVLFGRHAQNLAQGQHQFAWLDRMISSRADTELVSARRVDDDMRARSSASARQGQNNRILRYCGSECPQR